MALLGLDPHKFLNCRNWLQRSIMLKLLDEALELRKVEMHNQAVKIAEQVSLLFKT